MATRAVQKTGSTVKLRQQEATAANVASPKGISIKTPGKIPAAAKGGDHCSGCSAVGCPW